MTTQEKRYPAFTDTDKMTFGKYRNEPLSDVPASYFKWLWDEGLKDYSGRTPPTQQYIVEKIKLANYIWNNQDAISQELGDTFI